jgi:hypothetical protein
LKIDAPLPAAEVRKPERSECPENTPRIDSEAISAGEAISSQLTETKLVVISLSHRFTVGFFGDPADF